MIRKLSKLFFRLGFEPIVWLAALVWLGVSEPQMYADFTLCPLKQIGISNCFGCGLGRSVSFALHGELSQSFQAHWLGIPTIFILSFRIGSIVKNTIHIQRSYIHST